jgi:hypothetical protein
MQEDNVVPESTPETQDVVPEESVTEDSQPPISDENSESSTEDETVVDAVLNELSDDGEPEQIPDEQPEKEQEPEKAETLETSTEETPETTDGDKADELYSEPEGLKPKAQERFRSLVEANKSKDQELEESRNVVAEIQKTITNTGISPEEFGGLLDFARMATSQSPDEKKQAFQIAKNEMQRLAKEIGVEDGGVDLLDGYQDLQEKVDNYELDRSDAVELANARRSQQRLANQQEQLAQQQQQNTNHQSEIQQSTKAIEEYMVNRQKTDIDFQAKEKYLMGQVESIQQQYPPSQWPSVVAQLYDALGTMSGNQVQQSKLKASSPLQSSGQSVGASTPGSMADAIMSELS